MRSFLLLTLFVTIAFLLADTLVLADSTTPVWPEPRSMSGIQVYKISVTANNTGVIDYTSDSIYGELYAVTWRNNTANALKGTIYLDSTIPYVATIESYNTAGGNATEYTRTSSNMYFLDGPMRLHQTGGNANQTMEVWLFMQR